MHNPVYVSRTNTVKKYVNKLKNNNISVVAIDIDLINNSDHDTFVSKKKRKVFFSKMFAELEKNSINVAIIVDRQLDNLESYEKFVNTTIGIQQFRSSKEWIALVQFVTQYDLIDMMLGTKTEIIPSFRASSPDDWPKYHDIVKGFPGYKKNKLFNTIGIFLTGIFKVPIHKCNYISSERVTVNFNNSVIYNIETVPVFDLHISDLAVHNLTNKKIEICKGKCSLTAIDRSKITYVIMEPSQCSTECLAFAKCLGVDSIIMLTNDGRSGFDNGVLYLDESSLNIKKTKRQITHNVY